MSLARIVYVGSSPDQYVPDGGFTAVRGEPLTVGAALAGRPPGDWHLRAAKDEAHWPTRLGQDGSTVETYDPGEGLLAQAANWQPAPADTTDSKG